MKPSKVKPVSPDEVSKKKREQKISNIPDFVVEVVNELIIKNYCENTKTSLVKQDDILNVIVTRGLSTRMTMFENNYLDIEPLFESFGWCVKYDKPGYCESYPATFEFKRK
jgi:hypothetical protein